MAAVGQALDGRVRASRTRQSRTLFRSCCLATSVAIAATTRQHARRIAPLVAASVLACAITPLHLAVSAADNAGAIHGASASLSVPYFPQANDPSGRQGFVRVVNRSEVAGEVSVQACDDSGREYEHVLLAIGAGETKHFNSDDLEQGNSAKGLPDGIGAGAGDWRLELASELDIEVLSYIRTPDGFLTSVHDTAPNRDGRHEVHTFNPGSNVHQVSLLRLVNPGDEEIQVSIHGIDDSGASPGRNLEFPVSAGAALTLTAEDLESGVEGLHGALGDGAGKWQLTVESEQPLVVMSLLESPGGHLTNLSSSRKALRVSEAVEIPDTPVAGPWHFTNLHLIFETSPTDFETFCVEFAMESDVTGDTPIYLSMINQWINGLQLYAGIQTAIDGLAEQGEFREKRGRGAIFSRWEERALDAIQSAPGGLIESSGHEGNFIGVRNDFAWTQGAYRLCLVKGARVDGAPLPHNYTTEDIAYSWGRLVHTWVGLEATDLATGDTTFIGALAFPGETLALGYTTIVFYEAYGRQSFNPRDIPSFVVVTRDVRLDGTSVRFRTIREQVNPFHPDAPVMANSVLRDDGTIVTHVGQFTREYGRFWRELFPDH